jgi:hypothetical protein
MADQDPNIKYLTRDGEEVDMRDERAAFQVADNDEDGKRFVESLQRSKALRDQEEQVVEGKVVPVSAFRVEHPQSDVTAPVGAVPLGSANFGTANTALDGAPLADRYQISSPLIPMPTTSVPASPVLDAESGLKSAPDVSPAATPATATPATATPSTAIQDVSGQPLSGPPLNVPPSASQQSGAVQSESSVIVTPQNSGSQNSTSQDTNAESLTLEKAFGFGPAAALKAKGLDTVEKVLRTPNAELDATPGIGDNTIQKVEKLRANGISGTGS